MKADDNNRDNCYQNIIDKIPQQNLKLLMGDFNVQIEKFLSNKT